MQKYINLNAKVGMGEDYASAQEVMEQMDRLGVYTTVMEYTTGSNARYLNNKLLDMIGELPRDRVIPGYYLGMQTVFETGGMETAVSCCTLRTASISSKPLLWRWTSWKICLWWC